MAEVNIIGAGGHAQVVIALAEAAGHRIAGIYDDHKQRGSSVLNHPVTGPLQDLPDQRGIVAVIAVGDNAARQRISKRWQHLEWLTLIHPTAWVASNVILGHGCVVMAGAVLQPSARLGNHVIVNTMASVDHESVLDDFVHVAPGSHLAGNVHLQKGVFSGVGSSYAPSVTVGCWSMIGAGATVIHSLPAGITAVGVPAKVIKMRATR